MAITVAEIIDRVAVKLLDPNKVRWKPAELLADYNGLARSFVIKRPELGAKTTFVALAPASARQVLPADGVCFGRTLFNATYSAPNYTRGAAITQVDRDDLESCRPSWAATAGSTILHFIVDQDNPLEYWIYPQPASGFIELSYCAVPAEVVDEDYTEFPFPEAYEDAMVFGMMAMALYKNSLSGDIGKAPAYAAQCNELLGLSGQAKIQFMPASAQQEQAKEKA